MSEFPVIQTERLTLRKPTEDDIIPLLMLSQDEEVMEFYGMEVFKEEKQSREEIEWVLKIWKEKTGARWIISLKDNSSLIGDIGFYDYDKKHRKAEIGYKVARSHWRKGYMSEALVAVIDYVFKDTDINRLQAVVDPRNPASFLLLEKCGFLREGILRNYEYEKGEYVDLIMHSVLRREWESR